MVMSVIKSSPEKVNAEETNVELVFVHGAWHGAWCWQEFFLDYFSMHGYTSYALNLRGHGNALDKRIFQKIRIKDYVLDLADFVSSLDRLPILIGHSMGGFIVQKYLEDYSAFAAVLMASVPPEGIMNLNLRFIMHHPYAAFRVYICHEVEHIMRSSNFIRDSLFSSDVSIEKKKLYFSYMQNESYRALLDMSFLDLPDPKEVSTPLLVMGGSDDLIVLPRQIKRTANLYKTHPIIFPNMGHDMMLEKNWKIVANYIIDWLNPV